MAKLNNVSPMDVVMTENYHMIMEEYVLQDRPVMIKGAAKKWPAFTQWPSDAFVNLCGNADVVIKKGANKDITKPCSLATYLDYIKTTQDKEPYYLVDWSFSRQFPELMQDYDVPLYFENWLRRIPHAELLREQFDYLLRWIYIGAKHSGSSMHQDIVGTSAWNAVISGKKEWVFFEPNESDNIYEGKADLFNPDLNKYPNLANAKGLSCIQEPGDIVFTPSLWWHQINNVEAGISVTENFINESNIHHVANILLNIDIEDKAFINTLLNYIPEFNAFFDKAS